MDTREKKSLRRPVRSSAWFLIFTLGSRVLALLTTPIFTRLLSATEYSVIPLYLTWQTLFSSLITLELTGSVLLAVMAKHKEDVDALLSSTLTLCLFTLLFFFGMYLTFSSYIDSFTGLSRPLMLLLFAHTAANLPLTLYSAKAKYLYRPERTLPLLLATSVLGPAVGIALLTLTPLGALSRILGTVICTAIPAIPIGIKLIKNGKTLICRPLWRELLTRGLPLFPHYVALSVLGELGRLFVSREASPDALSKFGIAATLAHGVTMLTGAINSAFYPWLLRRLRAGEQNRVRRISSTVVFTVLLVMLAVSLIAPEAIALLAPAEYRGATNAILPLLYATVPAFLYTLFAGVTLYRERTVLMTLATLLSTIVGVLANLYLVRSYGYTGAAYASAISYFTLALSHLIVCAMGEKRQRKNLEFPCENPSVIQKINLCVQNLPTPLPAILSALLLSALPMLLLPPLFERPILRYLALIPTALALLLLAYRRRGDILDAKQSRAQKENSDAI